MKYKINLKEKDKSELEKVVRKQSVSQNIAKRARIILMANGQKITNLEIARRLGIRYEDITKWTKRWIEEEKIEDVEERLKDRQRSGRKPTITAEQWCKIMALACEKPEDYGVPITNWSHSTLTTEVLKQGIVEKISMSHVGNFLKKRNSNLTKVSTG